MKIANRLPVLAAAVLLVGMLISPRAQSQSDAAAVPIGAKDIGGVVSSPQGREVGVWVIAETTELPAQSSPLSGAGPNFCPTRSTAVKIAHKGRRWREVDSNHRFLGGRAVSEVCCPGDSARLINCGSRRRFSQIRHQPTRVTTANIARFAMAKRHTVSRVDM
jgi:hypothetical protein